MVITIHWSVWTVEYRTNAIHWAEYSFEPLPELVRRETRRMRCFRRASTAVEIEVPDRSRIYRDSEGRERLEVRDLRRNFADSGCDPETAAWRAHYGLRGFRYLRKDEQMAKRAKQADGPTLFGDGPAAEPAGVGAYGQAAGPATCGIPDRSIASELARFGHEPDRRELDSVPFEERARAVALEVVRQARADARAEVAMDLRHLKEAIRRLSDGMILALAILEDHKGLLVGTDGIRAMDVLTDCLLDEKPETAEQRTA